MLSSAKAKLKPQLPAAAKLTTPTYPNPPTHPGIISEVELSRQPQQKLAILVSRYQA